MLIYRYRNGPEPAYFHWLQPKSPAPATQHWTTTKAIFNRNYFRLLDQESEWESARSCREQRDLSSGAKSFWWDFSNLIPVQWSCKWLPVLSLLRIRIRLFKTVIWIWLNFKKFNTKNYIPNFILFRLRKQVKG